MNTATNFYPQITVDEVLSKWPNSHPAFTKFKTKCIGCLLQKFCTLRDVALTYQIPFEELIGELEKHISTIDRTQRRPNEKVV
jgi:hypothetical protein